MEIIKEKLLKTVSQKEVRVKGVFLVGVDTNQEHNFFEGTENSSRRDEDESF